jgi:hypothetical protein
MGRRRLGSWFLWLPPCPNSGLTFLASKLRIGPVMRWAGTTCNSRQPSSVFEWPAAPQDVKRIAVHALIRFLGSPGAVQLPLELSMAAGPSLVVALDFSQLLQLCPEATLGEALTHNPVCAHQCLDVALSEVSGRLSLPVPICAF